jgi:hypothetical protein
VAVPEEPQGVVGMAPLLSMAVEVQPMRIVITFLGTRPIWTEYAFQQGEGGTVVHRGRVFGEALRQWLAFDRMLVFATEEAESACWSAFEELGDPRIACVPIPLGRDEAELWGLLWRNVVQTGRRLSTLGPRVAAQHRREVAR